MELKEKLKKHLPTLGTWITLAHRAFVEISVNSGLDWICIDLEHSSIDLDQMATLINIGRSNGVSMLVRLSDNDPIQIKRVMDAGASGIIVPMVNSREQAMKAYRAMHYPPTGTRGVGLSSAQKYGAGFSEYREWLSKESVLIVQIEHIDAVNNFDDIMSVPGVDGFIVGPYDLSASLGKPGQFDAPDFLAAMSKIEESNIKNKKARGIHVVEPSLAKVQEAIKGGFDFIAYSFEARMYEVGMSEAVHAFKKLTQ
ncbi:2,4-dihydroxyhept-2-ene-1,7-dioic acid aldolase [Bdellovibrio bacteriovorus]|uniref:2,4-dihydroxyhept-2-ene-1,7-dioic acid aldolase n=1 Tax=Bdellovibrio bacteriovorus TaxID=959 RepID=A0A150WL72_BDEBC|nr:aldolase/citrate lyase family protein [Bdellovibrio bacteriovorus]KYG64730.1 2,4-dihydroxyhept-2-ene-1,7-dioic acid aldolase [Bdellovibrio bacteriovorus]